MVDWRSGVERVCRGGEGSKRRSRAAVRLEVGREGRSETGGRVAMVVESGLVGWYSNRTEVVVGCLSWLFEKGRKD